MKIIFFGPPGAGKGTQAEIISARLDIPTISTGNMLRSAVQSGTEMGMQAKKFMDSGALVPDEVVTGAIKERISQADCARGFILDGFPRTIPQARSLEELGIDIDVVLSLEVDDEAIVERMCGRRSCMNCGATYHIAYNPSAKGDDCEKCGSALTLRADDKPEVVKDRLHTYHTQTEPLKDYYAQKKLLRSVIGQDRVEDTTALTAKALGLE